MKKVEVFKPINWDELTSEEKEQRKKIAMSPPNGFDMNSFRFKVWCKWYSVKRFFKP